MKRTVLAAVILALAAGGAGFWYLKSTNATVADKGRAEGKRAKGDAGKGARGGPVMVRTEQIRVQPMPVILEAVGSVEPEQSVQVRPQVSGVLEAVLFREGDNVKSGQLLFRIDPRPFQASYNQSRAALARDEAQLAQARAQQARLEPLVKQDYITKQEYDVATTSTKSFEATVEANKAALEQARLQLSYTRILAPISGRTGSLSIKPGNVVSGSTAGGQPLVVINSMHPILAAFSVPQKDLEEVRRHKDGKDMRVEILAEKGGTKLAEGKLVFIDNAINPQTGAVLLKARVANDKDLLWPGQFVGVRVVLRVDPESVVVPERAVQPGQQGPYVYLVEDGRARVQPVTPARQVGELVVVAAGLKGGETVITEFPQALAPGAAVQVAGAEAPRGEGRKGRGDKGKGERKKAVDAQNADAGDR